VRVIGGFTRSNSLVKPALQLPYLADKAKAQKTGWFPIANTLAESLTRYIRERKKKNITCPEFFASANSNTTSLKTG